MKLVMCTDTDNKNKNKNRKALDNFTEALVRKKSLPFSGADLKLVVYVAHIDFFCLPSLAA